MKRCVIKLLSVLVLVAMLMPAMVLNVAADETLPNVAPLGEAYASSIKHPDWTPAKSINDDVDDWHGWEPLYPTVPAGAAGLSGEYCGVKFESFYEISGAFLQLRSAASQNITYTIQALVMGEWQDMYVLHDNDYEGRAQLDDRATITLECTFDAPVNTNNIRVLCSDYAKGFGGGDELIFPYVYELKLFGKPGLTPSVIVPEGYSISSNVALAGTVTASSASNDHWPAVVIDNDATDKTWMAAENDENAFIGVVLSEAFEATAVTLDFGSGAAAVPYTVRVLFENGVWEDVYTGTACDGRTEVAFTEPLCITEVSVVFDGVGGQMKEILVTSDYNAAAGGVITATSEAEGFEASKLNTADGLWKAAADSSDTTLTVELPKVALPNAVTLNFGADAAPVAYTLAVVRENGVVTEIGTGTASAEAATFDTSTLARTGAFISKVLVRFEGTGAQLASLSVSSNNFAFFRTEEKPDSYKQSCAKGNLAILGTAYAESVFPDYASIDFLNDGLFSGQDKSWFAHGYSVPTYCGIKLDKVYTVNKVDLVFLAYMPAGTHVMSFDVQALVDGKYVTVASGQSYNKDGAYRPVFTFDPVETDDIRIVFTSNGGVFPNLREIEIYSETDKPIPYMGYPTIYPVGGRAVTKSDAKNEEIVYDTTTRNTIDPIAVVLEAISENVVLSAAIGSMALLAVAGAAIIITNKKNV